MSLSYLSVNVDRTTRNDLFGTEYQKVSLKSLVDRSGLGFTSVKPLQGCSNVGQSMESGTLDDFNNKLLQLQRGS